METNDAVGNVPIIVPTAEIPIENSVTANVNPAETAETPCGHETVTETPKRVCEHCGRVISENEDSFTTHDGKTICLDCYEEHYFTCEDCGEVYPLSESHDVGNGETKLVCDDCKDDNWRQCYECEEWINTDEGEYAYVDSVDDYVCNSCLDRHYCRCENCNEYFHEDDMYSVAGGGFVCETCLEDDYFTCYSCGERYSIEDRTCDDDGNAYCPNCADRRNGSHCVMEYHAGRKYNLYSPRRESSESYKENLFFGVELECEKGDFDADGFTSWTDDNNLVHFEHDGSLDSGGVEMITQPCTLLYHQRLIGWNDLCSTLVGQGFSSHNTDNCGLHVHLSRAALRPSTIVKMDVFINHAKGFWSQVARRERFYGCGGRYDEQKKASLAKGNFARGDYQGDRYTAVNTNNKKTVEIRIFRGTLKPETILGTIEILHGLVRFLDCVPIPRIYETEANVVKFIDFLAENHAKYPHVFPMLRRLVRKNDGLKKQIGKYYGQFCESRNDGEND